MENNTPPIPPPGTTKDATTTTKDVDLDKSNISNPEQIWRYPEQEDIMGHNQLSSETHRKNPMISREIILWANRRRLVMVL